jgi:hypothetical protein
LAQSRSFPIGAGQPVVDVDAVYRHTERCEAVSLGGEVLSVGGNAGVADLESAHSRQCAGCPPVTGTHHRTRLTGHFLLLLLSSD